MYPRGTCYWCTNLINFRKLIKWPGLRSLLQWLVRRSPVVAIMHCQSHVLTDIWIWFYLVCVLCRQISILQDITVENRESACDRAARGSSAQSGISLRSFHLWILPVFSNKSDWDAFKQSTRILVSWKETPTYPRLDIWERILRGGQFSFGLDFDIC